MQSNILNPPSMASLKPCQLLNFFNLIKVRKIGISLAVQWLRLYTPKAEDIGLIPGQGTMIPHGVPRGQINKYSSAFNKNQKRLLKILCYTSYNCHIQLLQT